MEAKNLAPLNEIILELPQEKKPKELNVRELLTIIMHNQVLILKKINNKSKGTLKLKFPKSFILKERVQS